MKKIKNEAESIFLQLLPPEAKSDRGETFKNMSEVDHYWKLIESNVYPAAKFWKSNKDCLPVLAKYARIYLAASGSSADVERLNKVLKLTLTTQRNLLSDKNLAMLVFINKNSIHKLESFQDNDAQNVFDTEDNDLWWQYS